MATGLFRSWVPIVHGKHGGDALWAGLRRSLEPRAARAMRSRRQRSATRIVIHMHRKAAQLYSNAMERDEAIQRALAVEEREGGRREADMDTERD